ncbi:hypothetical protein ACSFA3_22730 [Variovorax sp. RHLX14]|uniref:hypothetical protein n=1 Tax=unclassified Variovorax TaxID=663243 RepID=UPI003F4556A2
MVSVQSIQFFLKKECPETKILKELNSTLGFSVESLDVKIENAIGFLQVDMHSMGFRQSFLLSWPESVAPVISPQKAMRGLAIAVQMEVLLEPQTVDQPWQLTRATGEQQDVDVMELSDGVDVKALRT